MQQGIFNRLMLSREILMRWLMKMNVFHWHCDGMEIEIKKHPKLTELASDGDFYTKKKLKHCKYADERGIMSTEIDIPGHASALLSVYPEIGSTKVVRCILLGEDPEFNSALDPTNPKTYQLLGEIFDEVCPLFTSNYFHIGGDENNGKSGMQILYQNSRKK
jgi:hexosaminidase